MCNRYRPCDDLTCDTDAVYARRTRRRVLKFIGIVALLAASTACILMEMWALSTSVSALATLWLVND